MVSFLIIKKFENCHRTEIYPKFQVYPALLSPVFTVPGLPLSTERRQHSFLTWDPILIVTFSLQLRYYPLYSSCTQPHSILKFCLCITMSISTSFNCLKDPFRCVFESASPFKSRAPDEWPVTDLMVNPTESKNSGAIKCTNMTNFWRNYGLKPGNPSNNLEKLQTECTDFLLLSEEFFSCFTEGSLCRKTPPHIMEVSHCAQLLGQKTRNWTSGHTEMRCSLTPTMKKSSQVTIYQNVALSQNSYSLQH